MIKSKLWHIVKGRIARKRKDNVYASFGKGNERSIALNWGRSSGQNCSRSCRHHAASEANNPTYACYSTTSEKMRPTVRQSLENRENTSPLAFIGQAYIQAQDLFTFLDSRKLRLDWLRISAAGSVPSPDQIPTNERKRFETMFSLLVKLFASRGVKIHFPVETAEKQDYYQRLCGEYAVVRLSLQDSEALSIGGVVSCVVGDGINSLNSRSVRKDRISLAKMIASNRYQKTGRKTIVCPAIVSTFEKRTGIKCGDCHACANPNIDVLYPLHV